MPAKGRDVVTASEAAVLIERHDRVAVISLNRPERLNAWSADLGNGLLERLQEAAADDSIGGVILTGAGRGFSAGADLKNPNTHHRRVDGRPPCVTTTNARVRCNREVP